MVYWENPGDLFKHSLLSNDELKVCKRLARELIVLQGVK